MALELLLPAWLGVCRRAGETTYPTIRDTLRDQDWQQAIDRAVGSSELLCLAIDILDWVRLTAFEEALH